MRFLIQANPTNSHYVTLRPFNFKLNIYADYLILKKMAVTILEALQNASLNLDNLKKTGIELLPLVKSQLNNAVVLLEKGYDLEDEVKPLLEKYGDVNSVPIILNQNNE